MTAELVVLEPPLTYSLPYRPAGHPRDVALLTAPRYIRTGGMGRWHRPRSGVRHGLLGHVTYRLWCGYGINGDCLAASEPPAGEPACGTCEGRAVGAGQDDWPGGKALLFEPQRLTRPRNCPGSRSERLFLWNGRSAGRCLVCGDHAAVRAMGGAYNSRLGLTTHEPGPDLVPGCPFHAWRSLVVTGGRVACACTLEETG